MAHGLVHLAAVAKAHLDLGRVHVDIDPRRIHTDVQHVHRLALAVQHVLVGGARGVGDDLVAHEAAVDVGELLVGAGARGVGQAGAAAHAHRAGAVLDGHRAGQEVLAQHVGQALRQAGVARVFVDEEELARGLQEHVLARFAQP